MFGKIQSPPAPVYQYKLYISEKNMINTKLLTHIAKQKAFLQQ